MNKKKPQLGENIDAFLKSSGFSGPDFAKSIGMSYPQLSRYINGHNKPGQEAMEKIANGFGVSVNQLLENAKNVTRGTAAPTRVGPSPEEIVALKTLAKTIGLDAERLELMRISLEAKGNDVRSLVDTYRVGMGHGIDLHAPDKAKRSAG